MYNVRVLTNYDEHIYENVRDWFTPGGCLTLGYQDGSTTILAPGSWLEAAVSPVNNPQTGDYQV